MAKFVGLAADAAPIVNIIQGRTEERKQMGEDSSTAFLRALRDIGAFPGQVAGGFSNPQTTQFLLMGIVAVLVIVMVMRR